MQRSSENTPRDTLIVVLLGARNIVLIAILLIAAALVWKAVLL